MVQIYEKTRVGKNLSIHIVALNVAAFYKICLLIDFFLWTNHIFLFDLYENFRDALVVLFVNDFWQLALRFSVWKSNDLKTLPHTKQLLFNKKELWKFTFKVKNHLKKEK